MPSWLLLALFIVGCTLTVPAFVWLGSQSLRQAFTAWWFFFRYMLALAALGGVAALATWAAV
jgi:hypothetical protein